VGGAEGKVRSNIAHGGEKKLEGGKKERATKEEENIKLKPERGRA